MNIMAELAALATGFSGTMGVWAQDLNSGEGLSFGAAHESFPSASTIKLAILYELFRQAGEGRVDLDALWTMTAEDQVPGTGVLKDLSPGIRLPVRDLATLMMTISDNTASNLCIDVIGLDAVNAAMDDLGLHGLRLYNKFYKPQPDRPKNQATPAQLGSLMTKIVHHQVLTPEACEAMLGIMKRVQGPFARRFLPEVTQQPAPEGEPELIIAAKLGILVGCRHEVGAVWKGDRGYVYAIMTRDCKDERKMEDNEGHLLISRAVAVLHRHYLRGILP
ncbi:MAG: serine hydrolase [Bacillota bacterium]